MSPIALFPATSERDKISFHQLNTKTGHRIKYRKVDAETSDEVDSSDTHLQLRNHPTDQHSAPTIFPSGR